MKLVAVGIVASLVEFFLYTEPIGLNISGGGGRHDGGGIS